MRSSAAEAPHGRATTKLRQGFVPVGAIAVRDCGSRAEPSIRARAGGKSEKYIERRLNAVSVTSLATEARKEMWAGRAKGSVTCGCGCVLSGTAPGEVGRLQWHMLESGLASETAIRTRWHAAVRAALAKRIKRRGVVDGAMACWAMTAGRIHTAAEDQSCGWRAPPMIEEAGSGSWFPGPAAPPPCFGSQTRQSGAGGGAETDSDGDEVDSVGDPVLSRLTHRHARLPSSPRREAASRVP